MKENTTILENTAEGRLDAVIASLTSFSRSGISDVIKQGGVSVDGKTVTKPSFRLKGGETIQIVVHQQDVSFEKPTKDIKIDVVYEDDDVLVINKPRGLVVHPAPGHRDDTLVNYLFAENEGFDFEDDESASNRPGIVHRIDKDTSGLLVVAKNRESQEVLQKQVANHEFVREYLALVRGCVADSRFMIDARLTKPTHQVRKAVVDESGREAITHCVLLGRTKQASLLKCVLETGRTHQIRAHLAYIGHPVVGDNLYSKNRDDSANQGQCLHAFRLTFTHPRTGEKMTFFARQDDYFNSQLIRFFG